MYHMNEKFCFNINKNKKKMFAIRVVLKPLYVYCTRIFIIIMSIIIVSSE